MVIYKITNLLNEKVYIGQTKQPIEKRFLQHSKANSPLGQAMRQCGLENFTIEVVERCKTQAELNEREKFWIKVLKSKSPDGYNLASGGAGFVRQKNYSGDSVDKIFSNKLKMLRESRGITQAELSSVLSISPSTVGMWEQGRRVPDYENLKRIADYFNVSTDYLLGRGNVNRNTLLSSEQKKLLRGFGELNEESKHLILGMIGQLNVARASIPTTALAV